MNPTCRAAPLLFLVLAGAAPAQLPPPPSEIAADAIFRESFIAAMAEEPGDWQLQPTRQRGPAPTGRPPLAHEEMTWRRIGNDGALVHVTYWRYSSVDEARLALRYHRIVISIGTRDVKGFADEAFQPANGGSVIFRRGSFVFEVSARSLSPIALSKTFLDAADRVLAAAAPR